MGAETLVIEHQAGTVKKAADLPLKRGERLGGHDGGEECPGLAPAEGAEPVEPEGEGRGAQGLQRLMRRRVVVVEDGRYRRIA